MVDQLRPRRPDFFFELYGDYLENMSVVHKFGANDAIGTTLVPVTTDGIYRTPTTATALEIVSDDVNDTAGGSGAQLVSVQGLDSDWRHQEEIVALNGTTAVTLTNSFTRVYRMKVVASGSYATQSGSSHDSTITLRETGAGDEWAKLTVVDGLGAGQSLIGAYTIPKGKNGYIYLNSIAVEANKAVDMLFFSREDADDITTPYSGVMQLKQSYVGASGVVKGDLLVPINRLVGPCDVGFMGKVSTGTASISVDFYIILEDNDD